jgi:hypothetical protein
MMSPFAFWRGGRHGMRLAIVATAPVAGVLANVILCLAERRPWLTHSASWPPMSPSPATRSRISTTSGGHEARRS